MVNDYQVTSNDVNSLIKASIKDKARSLNLFKKEKSNIATKLAALRAKLKTKDEPDESQAEKNPKDDTQISYESRPNGGFSVFYTLPQTTKSDKTEKLQQLIENINNDIAGNNEVSAGNEKGTEDNSEETYDEANREAYILQTELFSFYVSYILKFYLKRK